MIFQAGDSRRAATSARRSRDAIFTHAPTLEAGQAFYRDIKARAAAQGRNPDHVLILPGVSPIIADTDEEARAKEQAILGSKSFERALAELGRPFGWHDFSQYDLDAPFPERRRPRRPELPDPGRAHQDAGQGERLHAARDRAASSRRRTARRSSARPRTVADEIQRWFEGRAFDGLNIHISVPSEFARFTDEVLPILRERGVVRSEYESTTLRGNLGLPDPRERAHRRRAHAQRQPSLV